MSGHFNDDFPMTMEREAGAPENVAALAVAFGMYPMIDKKASKKAGHDVYRDVEHIKAVVPGDKFSLHFQPATDLDRKRFPQAYKAFQGREQKVTTGMPIEEWAPINRSFAMTLRATHIHTVEALAEVHDSQIDRLGSNARELRAKAKAWLSDAKNSAASMEAAAREKALQDQLAAMQAQIAALSAGKPAPVAQGPAPEVAAAAIAKAHEKSVEGDVVAAARRPRARAAA